MYLKLTRPSANKFRASPGAGRPGSNVPSHFLILKNPAKLTSSGVFRAGFRRNIEKDSVYIGDSSSEARSPAKHPRLRPGKSNTCMERSTAALAAKASPWKRLFRRLLSQGTRAVKGRGVFRTRAMRERRGEQRRVSAKI
jgi:hypothetical protein